MDHFEISKSLESHAIQVADIHAGDIIRLSKQEFYLKASASACLRGVKYF
jgi:hypothetical protein